MPQPSQPPPADAARVSSVPSDPEVAGRAARRRAPRRTLGEWSPPSDRPDPVDIVLAQEATRVPELLPLRHSRMAESPFAFYRGAAAVMASDLASCADSGLRVQLCGDAHLANIGVFAAPDRDLVIDLNDFDETLPGPFEWDVARLAASFEIAGRSRDMRRAERTTAVTTAVGAYVEWIRTYAGMSHLDVWYDRLTPRVLRADYGEETSAAMMRKVERNLARARRKDRMRAFDKLVTVEDGAPRFRSDPPVLVPARDLLAAVDRDRVVAQVDTALREYRRTLQPDRRELLDRYRFVDLARKVVGVGSVGTRCWVALLIGRDLGDPLFLQVKEAGPSVLEAHLGVDDHAEHGQRVVAGQRLIQSAPDVFLGWGRLQRVDDGGTSDYYFRQLWDGKGSADVATMAPAGLTAYARVCGRVLARAHARTGDAAAIAAYIGKGDVFTRSLTQFARTCADVNERDHAAFVERVAAPSASPPEPAPA